MPQLVLTPPGVAAPPGPPAPAPPGAPPSPGMTAPAHGPNRKMLKKLLWRKIPGTKIEGGFWDDVRQSGPAKLDEEEIEKLFRR